MTLTDPYLLRGLLHCARCGRLMVPSFDRARVYSCGPTCDQPDGPASMLEADAVLGAVVRGAVTLHPDLATVVGGGTTATPTAVARWQRTNVTDRREMLITAYQRIVIGRDGQHELIWRDTTPSVDVAELVEVRA